MGLSATRDALELAADALRTHPAEIDETFWLNAARAALLVFNEHMREHYSGDRYVEGSFGTIAGLVRDA